MGLDPAYTNTSIDFGTPDVGARRARHQERGCRRGVPADGGGDQHRGRAGTAAERRGDEGRRCWAPATGRTSSTRRRRKNFPSSAYFLVRLQAGGAQDRGDQEVPGRPEEVRRLHRRARLRCLQRLHHSPTCSSRAARTRARTSPARASSTACTRHRQVRPGRARPASRSTSASKAAATRRRRRAAGSSGEGRQVRAVPEERQAGHRQARRHSPRRSRRRPTEARSKRRRPHRPRPRPHPDHQPTRGPHERNQHLRPRNARRAAHAGVAQRGALDPVPRGERHRRHPGADRGARVDERALQDRG